MNNLNWLVCYDIDGSNYDDKQTRTVAIAAFTVPFAAQDFIEKCLPPENHHRFYVKHKEAGHE